MPSFKPSKNGAEREGSVGLDMRPRDASPVRDPSPSTVSLLDILQDKLNTRSFMILFSRIVVPLQQRGPII